MAQSKATKKFEKRHLKDTLERRKGQKKTKQQQQLKARKKARRAEEEGKDASGNADEGSSSGDKKSVQDAFKDMSVDEFFAGGFEVPDLPKKKGSKRKRGSDEESEQSDQSSGDEPMVPDHDDASDSESDIGDFKEQLDALAKKDPEFHKMLKKDEPEVFDDLDNLELSDDEEEPRRKKQRKDADSDSGAEDNELDMATVKKWRKGLVEQHSLRAAKETVIAFRSAAQVSNSEAEDKDFKYSVSDPQVYHELLTTALKEIPKVFEHHLPVQESKNGKVHVPTDSKKFKTLGPILRSQISGVLHLLDHLSDPATLRLTLSSILPILPYLLSFKKLVRDVTKAVTAIWSAFSNTEATRIAAFLVMRRLVVIGDAGIRENVLKATYQSLVKGSRNTTVHTMPGVNLMKNSAAELWGLAGGEGGVAYTTSFTFIRSLAMHLRSSITNNSNESYKTVYNWQYVHSLDFWGRVLALHCADASSPLQPLIYPFTQVTLGALRLIPTATYFPLRFQLIRSLLRVSLATGTYIPLAAPLFEVLNSAEMRKAPKPSTLKPLDFNVSIRAPKSYLRTRTYQDGVGEQVQELLSEFFVMWAKNIAFPELALPVTVMLRRWLKEVNQRGKVKGGNKNTKINGMIQLLVQKIEANSRWVEEKRSKVEFAPNNRKGVDSFLKDVSWEKTPIGAYVVGQRKTRDEKAKIIEESRKEEERRRQKDKETKGVGEEDEMESDDEEESDAGDDDDDEEEEEEEEDVSDVEIIDGDDMDEDSE
jgi:nucleolar complex protein 2